MENEQTTLPNPTTPAPTNSADLATKADLYELDLRLGERFTAIHNSINGLGDRMTTHEAAHNQENREVTVEREVKLDAKKAGIAGLIASIGVLVAAAIKSLLIGKWGF